jgi:hypothetical protein
MSEKAKSRSRLYARKQNKTSARAILIEERRAKAVAYRKLHWDYGQIGKTLGCSPATAQRDVRAKMAAISPPETNEEARRVILARLDELAKVWAPSALNHNAEATKIYLKITHEIADIRNLRQPTIKGGDHYTANILNVDGEQPHQGAENLGIQVVMVTPSGDKSELPNASGPILDQQALPPPADPRLNQDPSPGPHANPNFGRPTDPAMKKEVLPPQGAQQTNSEIDTAEERRAKVKLQKRLSLALGPHAERAIEEGWNIPNPRGWAGRKRIKGGWMV